MIVTNNRDDTDAMRQMPSGIFLARHHSLSGPLCIISRCGGINPASYSVMFLDGNGGPALGDVWVSVKEEKIRREFLPLEHSVTMKNDWR